MGPFVVGLIAPQIATLKQKLTAYSLMAVSGLLVIFSAGYALNAVHSLLMFRYGGVVASLSIAGALLFGALISAGVAAYMKGRPAPAAAAFKSSPYSTPHVTASISRKSGIAIAAAIAGGLTAATAIALSKRLRMVLAGKNEIEPGEVANEPDGEIDVAAGKASL